MRPLDIHNQVKAQPFVPLRMYFSDGSHFDIPHPELVTVTRTVIALTIVGSPRAKLPERVILLDPLHVVRLEPVDGARAKRR